MTDIDEPARTPVLVEYPFNPWAGYPTGIAWYGPFAHYHSKGDLFLFVDGHVSWVPSLDSAKGNDRTRYNYRDAGQYFTSDRRFWY